MAKKILVIDDDRSFLNLCQIYLEKGGYETYVIENFNEAFEFIKKNSLDCIVMDLIMPGISPLELISKIKEKNFPIIVYTGYPGTSEFEEIYDYLIKMPDMSNLIDSLNKLFNPQKDSPIK